MPRLLYCVGQAVAQQGVGDIIAALASPVAAANLISKVAAAAWKEWRADAKQDKLNADILDVAKLEFAEAKVIAAQVAVQVAANDLEMAGHVERFVTLIPASIRASLRRPDDPTGTTLPADFRVADADDLERRLPARLPRFKPGDAPDYINGWELVKQLGAGGLGEAWLARNAEDHTLEAAFKFAHGMTDAEYALLNEGDVLNRIRGHGRHPGLVELLDRRTRGVPVPWLRYEYVPGGDLCRLILHWQMLPPADRLSAALAALQDLARTVGYFHRLPGGPVVHRDLKPSNILVTADGRLKVADFGIGAVSAHRAIEADRRGTLSRGAVLHSYLRGSHTPLYASPQQRAGSHAIDPRDDVHALGVIAYQMLTGRVDHGAGPDFADDLRELGAGDGLVALLGRCVSAKAERRPADGHELANGLDGPVHPSPTTVPPSRGSQAIISSAALLCSPTHISSSIDTEDILSTSRPAVKSESKPASWRSTLVVDASGAGTDYREIADAVAAATPEALIRVKPGVYRKPIVIDKIVEIAGDGPREQIILETVDTICLHLHTIHATVRGLTIRSQTSPSWLNRLFARKLGCSAVWITTGKSLIADCNIKSPCGSGIEIHGAESAPTIRGCHVHNSVSGMLFRKGAGGLVEDCEMSENKESGIEARGIGTTPTFRHCRVVGNRWYGILFNKGTSALAEDCEVLGNLRGGVMVESYNLDAPTAPTLRRCKVAENKSDGMCFGNGASGLIEDCWITSNRFDGIEARHGATPIFHRCQSTDNKSSGFDIRDGAKVRIEDCDIIGNTSSGVWISGSDTAPILRCCRITRNRYGVTVLTRSSGSIENCEVSGNARGPWDISFFCKITRLNNRE